MIRSESMDDKVRGQKGNSPDHQLRSLIMSKWERRWIFTDNQEVGLRSSHTLKECVIAHWSRVSAPKDVTG